MVYEARRIAITPDIIGGMAFWIKGFTY